MSEEEKPVKKVARKRVVKKGVRGQKVARKATTEKKVVEEKGESVNTTVEAKETSHDEAPTKSIVSQPEIEVVVESQDEGSEAPQSPLGDSAADSTTTKSNSSNESEGKKEGRRRNRNRRGGGKDREEGGTQKSRKIDLDEAAIKAWEIYQGELEEEGVSLVDSRRGREIARRCLELASVFCEERDKFLGKSFTGESS